MELEQRKETDMTDNADIADEMIEEGCPEQIATASYYLAVLNVPAMVVVHVLIFAYLLRWRATK